jgi:hypothetical protein
MGINLFFRLKAPRSLNLSRRGHLILHPKTPIGSQEKRIGRRRDVVKAMRKEKREVIIDLIQNRQVKSQGALVTIVEAIMLPQTVGLSQKMQTRDLLTSSPKTHQKVEMFTSHLVTPRTRKRKNLRMESRSLRSMLAKLLWLRQFLVKIVPLSSLQATIHLMYVLVVTSMVIKSKIVQWRIKD